MRAMFILALFFEMAVAADGARQDVAACENAADCKDAVPAQIVGLTVNRTGPCDSGTGEPCASSSRIDDALDTILCGNGLEAGNCQSAVGRATSTQSDIPSSAPQKATHATGYFGQDDGGC